MRGHRGHFRGNYGFVPLTSQVSAEFADVVLPGRELNRADLSCEVSDACQRPVRPLGRTTECNSLVSLCEQAADDPNMRAKLADGPGAW
jgi:hypothetical protein